MKTRISEVLDFWFVKTPSEKRFKKDEKFDQEIKENFLIDYENASLNKYDDWQDTPEGCLALVILLDQFSRNMFRDNKRSFEQDSKARLIVNYAIKSGYLDQLIKIKDFLCCYLLFIVKNYLIMKWHIFF